MVRYLMQILYVSLGTNPKVTAKLPRKRNSSVEKKKEASQFQDRQYRPWKRHYRP